MIRGCPGDSYILIRQYLIILSLPSLLIITSYYNGGGGEIEREKINLKEINDEFYMNLDFLFKQNISFKLVFCLEVCQITKIFVRKEPSLGGGDDGVYRSLFKER